MKRLLEEEELYNEVGCTAAQWEDLERRKKEFEERKKNKNADRINIIPTSANILHFTTTITTASYVSSLPP